MAGYSLSVNILKIETMVKSITYQLGRKGKTLILKFIIPGKKLTSFLPIIPRLALTQFFYLPQSSMDNSETNKKEQQNLETTDLGTLMVERNWLTLDIRYEQNKPHN